MNNLTSDFINKISNKTRAYIFIIIARLDRIILEEFFRFYISDNNITETIDELIENSSDLIDKFTKIKKQYQEQKIKLYNIEYPIDIFGQIKNSFLEIFHQIHERYANIFVKQISENLIVYIDKNKKEKLIQNLSHISLLRHYIVHGEPTGSSIMIKEKTIIKELDVEISLLNLFLFIPRKYVYIIGQKIISDIGDSYEKTINDIIKSVDKTMNGFIKNFNETNIKKKTPDYIDKFRDTSIATIGSNFKFIKRFKFIGDYNIGKIKNLIEITYTDLNKDTLDKQHIKSKVKEINKTISIDEIEMIFDMILDIQICFCSYYLLYFEKLNKIPKGDRLRNGIGHSMIFFNPGANAKLNYWDLFSENFNTVISFYNTKFKLFENKNGLKVAPKKQSKQLKSSFSKSLTSIATRKDYFYILLKDNTSIQIVNTNCSQTTFGFDKKSYRDTINDKIKKLKTNPNNSNKIFDIKKWGILDLLRLKMRNELKKCIELSKKMGNNSQDV